MNKRSWPGRPPRPVPSCWRGVENSSSSSTPADPAAATSPSCGGGVVRISGQNFTEAAIVADLYAGVLKKGATPPR